MKLLDLPDGIRATIVTIVVATLRNDPTLAQTIDAEGWRTYTDDADADPPGEDSLPSLEVLPFGKDSQPATLVTQDAPMGIGINIATAGLDVRDLLNLWEAVEAALWRGTAASALLERVRTALLSLPRFGQVANITLSTPAITPSTTAAGRQFLVAAGTIHVQLRIPK